MITYNIILLTVNVKTMTFNSEHTNGDFVSRFFSLSRHFKNVLISFLIFIINVGRVMLLEASHCTKQKFLSHYIHKYIDTISRSRLNSDQYNKHAVIARNIFPYHKKIYQRRVNLFEFQMV